MEMAGIKHRSDLLLEEEGDDADDLFGDDDADADAGDDDTGDDTGDDTEEDEGDAEEEAADDDDAEDEETPDQLSSKEIAELGPGEIDLELDSVMDDIFDKSQKAMNAAMQVESIHRNSISSLLFEEVDYESFDMDRFARETARYINNYENLLDIEGMLFNKAKQTLLNNFGDLGQNAVSEFEEHMSRVYGIDLVDKFKEDIPQPTAVGAGSDGAGA
jgi:hypothetical protein